MDLIARQLDAAEFVTLAAYRPANRGLQVLP
jgi:hypothetical protein